MLPFGDTIPLLLVPNEKEYHRYYGRNHRGQERERAKRRKEADPEKYQQYNRQRYQKDKEKIKTRSAKWVLDNPERFKQRCTEYRAKKEAKLPKDPLSGKGHGRQHTRTDGKNSCYIHFGDDHIHLSWNPRKGICSQCGKQKKNTRLHGTIRFPIFPWFGLVELCRSCYHPIFAKKKHDAVMVSADKRRCSQCGDKSYIYAISDYFFLYLLWNRDGKGGWLCIKCWRKSYENPVDKAQREWHIGHIKV